MKTFFARQKISQKALFLDKKRVSESKRERESDKKQDKVLDRK